MNEEIENNPLFLEKDGKSYILESETGEYRPMRDVREAFIELAEGAPRDIDFEQAFIAGKIRTVKTHPELTDTERDAAIAYLQNLLPEAFMVKEEVTPPPGGVGYGVFYKSPYKTDFATGSCLFNYIICPTKPGGNVSTWLYLTATNRTAKGVEAFVSYYSQNDLRFKVFDWARSEPWQIDIPYSSFGDYLGNKFAHNRMYQVLTLVNATYQKSKSTWRNEVYLWNYKKYTFDFIYSYDYNSSEEEQREGWIGSWGPIVETFQDSYRDTNQLGFLYARMFTRNSRRNWDMGEFLSPDNTYIRNDNQGFNVVFLDPNYSFAVK